MKEQLRLIQYALIFYTRLPVPSLDYVDQATQDHASRYFPLIGWIVGGLCALSFLLFNAFFSQAIAVLLMMCFSIWLTGAFHEDGLADTCDGMGGGWDKETILNIMKDSRVGTYGLVGLTAVLALKFLTLSEMPIEFVPVVLVVGHVLSRWVGNLIMWRMDYVRLDEKSKSKPITKGFSQNDFIAATLLAMPCLFLLPAGFLWAALGVFPLNIYFVFKLKQWLGGYTGDTLGAAQQLAEVGFYLGISAFLTL